MSLHWWHVTLAWALAAMGFGGMAAMAAWRHALARRRLRQIEPRREGRA
ncbi:hypothetical protein [Roseomonas sp. KE0001]|nr:hypothetical protein [Roseomonas sp. KE0001]